MDLDHVDREVLAASARIVHADLDWRRAVVAELVAGIRRAIRPPRHLHAPGLRHLLAELHAEDEVGLALDLIGDQGAHLETLENEPIASLADGRRMLVRSRAFAGWLSAEYAWAYEQVPHPDAIRRVIAIASALASGGVA